MTSNRRWQIINKCLCVCVCVQHSLVCTTLLCYELLLLFFGFFSGSHFTLPCQPFHIELGHEGSEFRSGCCALTQLRTLLLMRSEETSERLTPHNVLTWNTSQNDRVCKKNQKRPSISVCPLKSHLILVWTPFPHSLWWKWDARLVISGW